MNEESARKQKLIDDQTLVIKSLREKIESLEEEHDKSRADLETRLNEREADLKLKIATFEANLNEGRHYFEDVLREKQAEIEQLRKRLAQFQDDPNGTVGSTSTAADNEDSSECDSSMGKNFQIQINKSI